MEERWVRVAEVATVGLARLRRRDAAGGRLYMPAFRPWVRKGCEGVRFPKIRTVGNWKNNP